MAQSALKRPDGAKLAVFSDGEGPDLVLVTGLSGTAGFWDPVVGDLAGRYRVTRFDQRGIGASTRGEAPLLVETLAEDCRAVMEHVGCKRTMLLGHSMGGIIAQSLALDGAAGLSGLILSGTWARPNPYMAEMFRARNNIMKAAPREYTSMLAFLGYPPDWLDRHWAFYRTLVDNAPVKAEQQQAVTERIAALLAFDRSADLARLELPTLVQGAEDDLIVPGFLQHELHALMPGSALSMMANGGHFFPVSRPEAFVRAIDCHAERIGLRKC